MRTLIAIDPGVTGAIAWRLGTGAIGVNDLPCLSVFLKSKKKDGTRRTRNRTDGVMLSDTLRSLCAHPGTVTIGVEALPNRPFSSSTMSAMFQGMNYGIALGVAESVDGAEVVIVDPAKVREFAGVLGEGGDHNERKEANVGRAVELFPALRNQILVPPTGRQRKTQIKDGRADALLMLAYMIDKDGREG